VPARLAAAVPEIERERADLLAMAAGMHDQRESRARQLLARIPDIVRAYSRPLQQALKVMADDRLLDDARQLTRGLLADGQIVLAPTPDHTAVTGPVRLAGLGELVLGLAGWQRQQLGHAVTRSGSGPHFPLLLARVPTRLRR
jgi:hypothetical protein